jgi:vacuolar iron transporter family protein
MTSAFAPANLQSTFRHYIRDLVYGANDGLITTFAIAAGVTGAQLSASVVLILGVANLLADGFSMGASNYLSLRSEGDVAKLVPKTVALRHGTATFIAFIVAGSVPLMAYVTPAEQAVDRFPLALALTMLALFGVGAARTFVSDRRWWHGGLEMLSIGALAAAVAYGVGWLLARLVGGVGAA